ncbi:MAG: gamma-glutamyl-phosphate reductase, partial [Propionibacterium sp.]|nr:gamma-glutamyl-phosphate reductase [Propionibacterium sp.]
MDFRFQAMAARAASRQLATLTRDAKDDALRAMADSLASTGEQLLEANEADVSAAREAGTPEGVIDRLRLDAARIAAMAQGLRDVASLPDPVGDLVRGWRLGNG